MRITKKSVEAIELPEKGKRKEQWDSQLSGFGVQVTSSGNRSYIFQYRMGGREVSPKRITIGRHGDPWTADGARQHALDLRELVRKGMDPKILKEEQRREAEIQRRQANQLEFETYAKLFLAQYITKKGIKRADEIAKIFERDLIPKLSGLRIDEISEHELRTWLVSILPQKPPVTHLVRMASLQFPENRPPSKGRMSALCKELNYLPSAGRPRKTC